MHFNADRRSRPARVGQHVHERGAPQHSGKVVEVTDGTVVVEYDSDSKEIYMAHGEFREIFEVA